MGWFTKKKKKRPYCTAVVAAAGTSSRMGGVNKLFCPLGGMPVLAKSLLALQNTEDIDAIVVAAASEDILPIGDLGRDFYITKLTKIVRGGPNRVQSVMNALLEAPPQTEIVAVHDGARPLVTPELIARVVREAVRHTAAAPVVPLVDTIKACREDWITRTVPREELFAVQTPQAFDVALLKGALTKALAEGWEITDDASAVERLGARVRAVQGETGNIKITTPADVRAAQGLCSE